MLQHNCKFLTKGTLREEIFAKGIFTNQVLKNANFVEEIFMNLT